MKTVEKIYIAGALTHAGDKQKKIYEQLARICSTFFPDTKTYVPHLNGTDPVLHPGVTPQDVWKIDYDEVTSSDILLAFVGEPSLGTGAELEISRISGKKIILWSFKGQKVSRMALGNPAVSARIEADDENDLFVKIEKVLKKFE